MTNPWVQLRAAQGASRTGRVGDFVAECVAVGVVGGDRRDHIRAAVAFLGPTAMPDDVDAVELVIEHAAALTDGRDELPINVAVALGAGWHREHQPASHGTWDGIWDRAIFAIADEFQRSLQFTAALLHRLVPEVAISRGEQRSLAELFAIEFVRGCRCGRHRRACLDPGGHRCCITQHAIAGWDPTVAHLSAYVDQAVRGLAGTTIRGAAFADGMLYAELKRSDRLRRANVEAFECSACGDRSETQHCAGARCDQPNRTLRRVMLVNRLVVPVEAGGSHAAERRYLCAECHGLFLLHDGTACPACGWVAAGTPPTRQVWVRRHRSVVRREFRIDDEAVSGQGREL